MKRSLATSLAIGLLLPISIGASITWGASTDTGCWDEYDTTGRTFYRTVTPKDLPLNKCTPGAGCFAGYNSKGKVDRLYVPFKARPLSACVATTPTTTSPTTSTTTAPAPTAHFATLPVGAALPSDADCAARVRRMTENRPENAGSNATRGVGGNTTCPRVTGNFVGTTDEIIQWTACKWGLDEDLVRSQIVVESAWKQPAMGDFTTNSAACAPGFPIGTYPAQWSGDRTHTGECPESIGLGQVRWSYHQSAFANDNASKSSAYNLDYTYATWRECFEGRLGWLNTVERGATYAAGDALGCMGVWFSGRWYTDAANGYMAKVQETLTGRSWEQSWFGPASAVQPSSVTTTLPPTSSTAAPTTTSVSTTTKPPTTTAAPTTTKPPTTTAAPTTTKPPATTTTTTKPPTTTSAPATTVAPAPSAPTAGAQFVATFDNNTGLERFRYGVYHRTAGYHEANTPVPFPSTADNAGIAYGEWTGDHDTSCGGPDTQRQLSSRSIQDKTGAWGWHPKLDFHTEELVYLCKDHLMDSMGEAAGYSIVWFSPNQTFNSLSQVSFDVNLTDLGARKWWKVGIVSDSLLNTTYGSDWDGAVKVPGFMLSDVGASGLQGELAGPDRLIATWSGGASGGYAGCMKVGNTRTGTCANPTPTDKATRHPVTFVDNRNGTVTFTVAGVTATVAGSFPACPCRVVFYDHNYTPDKDGPIRGHTWHWDNIIVR